MAHLTLADLQRYIKEKDYRPALKKEYFLKLAEEVGELSRAVRKDAVPASAAPFKGSVQEELCDVLYYTLALANVCGVDLEEWFPVKERLNDEKYGTCHAQKLSRP